MSVEGGKISWGGGQTVGGSSSPSQLEGGGGVGYRRSKGVRWVVLYSPKNFSSCLELREHDYPLIYII